MERNIKNTTSIISFHFRNKPVSTFNIYMVIGIHYSKYIHDLPKSKYEDKIAMME